MASPSRRRTEQPQLLYAPPRPGIRVADVQDNAGHGAPVVSSVRIILYGILHKERSPPSPFLSHPERKRKKRKKKIKRDLVIKKKVPRELSEESYKGNGKTSQRSSDEGPSEKL